MTRPRLLDLFCGAGGAAMGYYRAGFDVVGVDIKPQKHYPFPFIPGDALDVMAQMLKGEKFLASDGKWYGIEDFDAIHGSPPCQIYSTMTNGRWKDRLLNHPDLIDTVRGLINIKPYVIENVSGARGRLINPIMLCGTMFGLETTRKNQLRRHRYFECSHFFILTPSCQHNKASAIGIYGGGQNPARKKYHATIGVCGGSGGTSNRDGLIQFGIQDRMDAMGIDWMTGDELSEAIPPAYTEYIGDYLLKAIQP